MRVVIVNVPDKPPENRGNLSSMTPNSPDPAVTLLLQSLREGDALALDSLFTLVYDELRALSAQAFRGESAGHMLQPTALVHEVFVRLVSADADWNDRAHFFAIAARMMRRVLVDHARERGAAKRGGGWIRTTLDEGVCFSGGPPAEILDLDRALERLAEQDDRASRAAEMHYFGGLTYEETALALDISSATVDRDLRFARTWLRRALSSEQSSSSPTEDG